MPGEGFSFLPHEDILSFEEIERVCRIGVRLGITKIKLTGGEPLVRRGEPGGGGSGDAAFAGHSHAVKISPWLPSPGDYVLCIYLPTEDGDGFVIGGI